MNDQSLEPDVASLPEGSFEIIISTVSSGRRVHWELIQHYNENNDMSDETFTNHVVLHYVSGDNQTGPAGAVLKQSLQVRLSRALYPYKVSSIAPRDIFQYLEWTGWRYFASEAPAHRNLVVFNGPLDDAGRPIHAVFPGNRDAPDYAMRVDELVDSLAVLEDRCRGAVLRDIIGISSPVGVRFVVESGGGSLKGAVITGDHIEAVYDSLNETYRCDWTLGSTGEQRVTAYAYMGGAQASHQVERHSPVTFVAEMIPPSVDDALRRTLLEYAAEEAELATAVRRVGHEPGDSPMRVAATILRDMAPIISTGGGKL